MVDEALVVEMRAMVKVYRNFQAQHLRVCPDPNNCTEFARLLGRLESWEMATGLVETHAPSLRVSLN